MDKMPQKGTLELVNQPVSSAEGDQKVAAPD